MSAPAEADLAAPQSAPSLAGWSRLELAIVLGGIVYCAGPWRRLESDLLAFGGALLVFMLARAFLRPPAAEPARARRAVLVTLIVTAVCALGLLVYGWQRAAPGLTPAKLCLTLALYLPFAWIQQSLTQGFLVSRLRRGWPLLPAAVVGGLTFSLCHLPMPDLLAPTALCGIAWSWAFLASGRLWPVVLSHAVLGATFFLAVVGRDPFRNLL